MKQFKRWMSLVLSMCILVTTSAVPVAATTEVDTVRTVAGDVLAPELAEENGDFMPAAISDEVTEVDSGTCGAGVRWVLTSDKVLTISGSGPMDNYTREAPAPWYSKRNYIKYIRVEDGVTSIGNYAFYYQWGLDFWDPVTLADSIVSIGDYAFNSTYNIRSVKWPSSLTHIGAYAFSNAGLNSELVLPDTLTSLGEGAFSSCGEIYKLTIPGSLREIPAKAFSGNSYLHFVTLNEGLTSIGDHAFTTSNLGSVEFPSTLTSIGDSAFSSCNLLTSVYIPATVTELHEKAFAYCEKLTAVHVDEDNEYYTSVDGVLYNEDKTELLHFPMEYPYQSLEIPDTVTAIKATDLSRAPYVLHMSLPAAMTEPDIALPTNLLTLRIPATVTKLNYYDLYGTKICHVYYGGSESQWNEVWFNGEDWYAPYDGTVHFDGTGHYRNDIAGYPATDGDIYIDLETGTVVHCDNGTTAIDIPASIDSIPITGIGPYAFSDYRSELTRVTLPDTLTHIDDGAFMNTRITSIDLPDSLTMLGSQVFSGYNLTSVTVPGSVTVLGDSVFSGSNNLKEVTLENGVTEIGDSAFDFCYSLNSVSIPESVVRVGDFAFSNCSNLTTLAFPGDNIHFGMEVFRDSSNLKSLRFSGTAPTVNSLNTYWPSFPQGVMLYCMEKMKGWTDSNAYSWYDETWNGWPLVVLEDVTLDRAIVPLQPDGITINGKGNAFPHFRLVDYYDNPIANEPVAYQLEDGGHATVYTDGNGLFSVPIYNCTTKDYTVEISLPGFEDTLYDSVQTVPVTVQSPSYKQTWSGSAGASASVSLDAGAGISVGVASASASLASAGVSLGVGNSMEITSEMEDNTHNIEIKYSESAEGGLDFKSGIDATLPNLNFELVSASAGVTGGASVTHGLRIEDFDPDDPEQALMLTQFLLQMALQSRASVLGKKILERLDVHFHNLTGWEMEVFLDSGASVLGVESTGANKNLCSLAGADASYAYSSGIEEDHLNDTLTRSFGVQQDLSAGTLQGLNDSADPWGDRGSNALEMSMEFEDNYLNELAFRVYTGGKQDIVWDVDTVDTFRDYIYKSGTAAEIVRENTALQEYCDGERILPSPGDVYAARRMVSNGDYNASYEDKRNIKRGGSLEFPFEISCIAGAGVSLSGDLVDEFSYTTNSGLWNNSTEYRTAQSTMTTNEMEVYRTDIFQIFGDAVKKAGDFLYNMVEETFDYLRDGVTTVYSSVTGTVEEWYVSVKTAITHRIQSYAILSLASEEAPVSSAAVSATIGEPHDIAVYTDSTMETLVSNDALAESPLTLTLTYTDDMLAAAGASAEDDISVYRFDSERNLYVYLPDCVQDKTNQTVTAFITRNGEYILATDSASPLVSDFATSNLTATPTITALISDMSGLSDFRFWLDEGETLVDMTTLDAHYETETNLFTYQVTTPLASGEHTAYFQTADALGNTNGEPFAFTFVVDAQAPVISDVSTPTETVTTPEGFVVTANVTDNSGIAQVMVRVDTGHETFTLPMTETDGLWSGVVTDIDGADAVSVTVVATDGAGNRAESASVVVSVDIPSIPRGIVLSGVWKDNAVDATVKNAQISAIGGCLLAVAYDEDGKMLDFAAEHIALLGQEEANVCFRFPKLKAEPAICKLVLLSDENTFRPLCKDALVQ